MASTLPTGAIGRLMEELGKLPGIGPKSSERITHFLLAAEVKEVMALAELLPAQDIVLVVAASKCQLMLLICTEGELCNICSDGKRDPSVLCVVEQPRDLMSIERAGAFRGLYHVLQGRLAPLDGIGPEKLTIDALLHRVSQGVVKEVIMATNPTLEGDGTALYISNLLASYGVKITRLARGLPSGSVLEFANSQMLADALEGRRVF